MTQVPELITWIRTDDRLPEVNTRVLTYYEPLDRVTPAYFVEDPRKSERFFAPTLKPPYVRHRWPDYWASIVGPAHVQPVNDTCSLERVMEAMERVERAVNRMENSNGYFMPAYGGRE